MSVTSLAAVIALLTSLAALLPLALFDPKRLRSVTASGSAPHARTTRRLLTAVALLPGVVLIALAFWPAFLIWLGVVTALGWCLVQLLAARQ